MRAALALCALAAVAGLACAHANQDNEAAMTKDTPPPISGSSSRPPPPEVAAVTLDGVRYEPARDGLPHDATDTTGWLRATRIDTGEELWLAQVYTAPPPPPDAPAGVLPPSQVYIARLEVEGGLLRVTDERGRRFHVDPDTGASVPVR